MPAEPNVRFQNPPSLPKFPGFSQVAEVQRGKIVYISGQVAVDAPGALVGKDDFRAQVEQTFVNLGAAVAAAGGNYADFVKLNYYCVDSAPADALLIVREIRDRFLNTEAPPASTFVFVSRLARPEWLIEIEAIAAIDR
jgi:enamine deaminase RidA (YjgF/YER057c/UK114 family)